MEGITINEMCEKLKLPFKTVEGRIQRAGIKPLTKQALYPYETLDVIKKAAMGRPKKPETETKTSKNKPVKKLKKTEKK